MIEYLLVSIEGDHIQDHRRVPTYGNSLKYEKETNHTPNLVQILNYKWFGQFNFVIDHQYSYGDASI
ncbi:hypothetical protein DERP_002572 [Dermatophagoides pteronyssinus]|uniref:Uncharacterized protein n=1 Tax=Dermatophagoides pteronyssinus TaxID=6956 RepID=A0ABQ8JIR0_DERPT|nr:hypothetical protein DERP_002572 [Dermatophagoides pteronyssinus]